MSSWAITCPPASKIRFVSAMSTSRVVIAASNRPAERKTSTVLWRDSEYVGIISTEFFDLISDKRVEHSNGSVVPRNRAEAPHQFVMCTKRFGMGDTEDLLQIGEQRFPDADRIVDAAGVIEFPSLFNALSKSL